MGERQNKLYFLQKKREGANSFSQISFDIVKTIETAFLCFTTTKYLAVENQKFHLTGSKFLQT
jgi:hypothetical protein